MRVIDCSGDPQQIGECTGEALRLEIAEHIELFPMQRWQEFDARLPDFLEALQRHLPQVLEEIRATARAPVSRNARSCVSTCLCLLPDSTRILLGVPILSSPVVGMGPSGVRTTMAANRIAPSSPVTCGPPRASRR